MSSAGSAKLFQPTRLGDIELGHRVVFAPTTRFRANAAHAPFPHVAEYYEQCASTPGSLLISDSEATFIAARAGGHRHAPGIWSEEQIAAWKILWALGRAAEVDVLNEDGLPYVSASVVPLEGGVAPRPLTVQEIREYVQPYATAASNAVHKAGLDGVEIYAANGYLLDQFLHDRSNVCTDACGGSVENRTRLPLEVADAVVKAVGQKKTAMRISPWGTYLDMHFDNPKPTYAHLVTELRERYPDFAYLHTVEIKEGYSNDFIRDIWGDRRLVSADWIATAEEKGELISDRFCSVDLKGYTDYPFAAPEAH
ncbi:hypothetical protein C8R47DRAFT_1235826 [Mycena vitilis]|nr:hypothetical protein C8R47DRAFT_1235826 [Mycena vitilis]